VSNWYTELKQKLNEGYAGGDDVAHIESYLDYIDQLTQKMSDTKLAYEIQNAADDIRKALELDPTNVRAKFNEATGDGTQTVLQAVGELIQSLQGYESGDDDIDLLVDELNGQLAELQAKLEGDYASFDESKSQGDAWYKEQRAKEAYEKANPGKSWRDLPYGYKEDWREKTESVKTDAEVLEAVGDSAEAFYKLQDEFCGGESPSHAHRALIDELVRYLSGDQIADFVADFRRHYDMNDMEESVEEADSELSVMANSSDNVERTYAEIIKGDAEQSEVGDYIGKVMTKDEILKLIDMLEPQGYDKDFLLKDLAPMMEANCKRRRLSKEEKQEFRLREKKLHETSRVRSLKDELIKEMGD
jgi:hypothetical protein